MIRALALAAIATGCAAHGAPEKTSPMPPGMSEPAIVPLVEVPADALEIAVAVKQWSCSVRYPGGAQSAELHVPAGRAVRMVLTTSDVAHEVEIEQDVHQHVTPGAVTQLGFRMPRAGTYAWKCPTDVPPRQSPDNAAHAFFADSPAAFTAFTTALEEAATPKTAAARIAFGRTSPPSSSRSLNAGPLPSVLVPVRRLD